MILNSAINVLDGTITVQSIDDIASQCNISRGEVEVLVKAAGGLFWEFVKSNSINSLTPVLQQVGFDGDLAAAFGKVSTVMTCVALF